MLGNNFRPDTMIKPQWLKLQSKTGVSLFVCIEVLFVCVEVFSPVNPMGSCQARSVYLTTRLLGRFGPLGG